MSVSRPATSRFVLEKEVVAGSRRWTSCLHSHPVADQSAERVLLGVLPGEGVGPEVIACALDVLDGVASATGLQVEIRNGGPIGRHAERLCGSPLSVRVIAFCEDVFADKGAVLSGPGGGRYVYDLRKQFDLFFKISPLSIAYGVPDASRLKPETLRGVDILVTRENCGGIYQGGWNERENAGGDRIAEHQSQYAEAQVRRFLNASARLAAQRRGNLTVVWKEAGLPSISSLWRDCAADAAAEFGVDHSMVDVDLMAYRLIQEPTAFDVIAAPNLFGDVLADLGAVLVGSRGVTFSGNYNGSGHAVYQTNHGAAYDLAGTDRANPAGQILSLAMMLRETFGLVLESQAIEQAVRDVWRAGWRTEDVVAHDTRVVGTQEFGARISEKAASCALQSIEARQPRKVAACN